MTIGASLPDVTPQEIRPQPGPQELFLSTPADLAVIGGSVYGGKSWCLVIEALRHIDNPAFNFVCFRREMPEITQPGGLWDESLKWYPAVGGEPRENMHEWFFPSGAWGKFSGLQLEKDKENFKGAQICLLMFDQLEMFTETQFWYLLSRNRSLSGIPPYMRASVNPDPDSFLATLLAWWIDQDSGYSLPERSGIIRWFLRQDDDRLVWSTVECPPEDYANYEQRKQEARAEIERRFPGQGRFALSLTYVLARLQDNKIGQEIDPDYEARVRMLTYVERERLLGGDRGGNWKVRATAGKIFNRAWFDLVEAAPVDCVWVRYWDKAGTEGGGCNSAGVRLGYSPSTRAYYVASCIAGQWSAHNREAVIRQTAELDGPDIPIYVEQEPGSGGKESAINTVLSLPGYVVRPDKVTGEKIRRAYPLSAMSEARNVKLVRGAWTEEWLTEAHQYEDTAPLKDRIDATAGAFNKLAQIVKNRFDISGGGAVPPLAPVPLGENGHAQLVDPDLLSMIRHGGGMGFR